MQLLPVQSNSYANACNYDGSIVVGYAQAQPGYFFGWRWTAAGLQLLPEYPQNLIPWAITPDGSTIVGDATYCTWRMVGDGQLECVNPYAEGRCVSADGSVIAGGIYSWTAATGSTYLPDALINGVSANGTTLVGSWQIQYHNAAWWDTAGNIHELVAGNAASEASAHACDDEGKLIIGHGPNGGFIWTDAMGALDLRTVLLLEGADLDGWTLDYPTAITPDGKTMAGTGTHNNQWEGWIATLGVLLTTEPRGATACRGTHLSFTATADGGPLSWTWYRQGVPVSPENGLHVLTSQDGRTSTLVIDAASGPDSGLYRCSVTDGCANVSSSVFHVYVNSADFNGDGDTGTDADVESFFECLAGQCCPTCGSADFNGDGDVGTDADIESFFRVLAGGPC
jgi:hypothetical protein